MILSERISQSLYWILVLQVCIISVSIAASSLLFGLAALSVTALLIAEKQWIIPKTPIDYAVAAYAAAEIISAIVSDHRLDALANTKRLLLILIVYAVVISFNSRDKIRKGVMLLAGSVALLSAVEIYFYFADHSERLYLFQHYMTTGGLKMIMVLMLAPFLVSRETPSQEKLFYAAAFVPILSALLLTNTRSAWLGLLFGLLVIGLLHYRSLFGVIAAGMILFFSFAPEQQIDRAKSIVDLSNPTNVGRLNMWSTGLTMWQDRPLFGFGDIDLYETYLTYRTPTGDEPAGHLHNNFIHLLVTLGAVGLIAVLYLFYSIAASEIAILRRYRQDPFIRNIALGSIAVFSGFLVNGMFEWNFGDHEIMVFVWFTIGLAFASPVAGKEGAA